MVQMGKLMQVIHGSNRTSKHSFINNREITAEAYERFATQRENRNIFYVVLNGVAMPIVS